MTWTYVLAACVVSCGIGAWIGWMARSLKEAHDRRDLARQWDRRQRANATIEHITTHRRYLR